MTIKHLVISGGGPTLVQTLASIQELERKKYIDRKEIQTIYGTSAGAILGILLCLNMDWESINDYIIKRPWHDVFPIKVQNVLDAYTKKGIFDIKTVEKCFKPLLDAKDLSMEITLEEFYKFSNIELHFFTFEMFFRIVLAKSFLFIDFEYFLIHISHKVVVLFGIALLNNESLHLSLLL